MNILISAHLQGEDRTKFEQLWKSQTMIRGRLEEILKQKIEAAERERISANAYGQPTWAYKQADTNGFIRALTEVLQLVKDKQD